MKGPGVQTKLRAKLYDKGKVGSYQGVDKQRNDNEQKVPLGMKAKNLP